MSIKSHIDKNEKVENTDRKFGAASEYFPCYVTLLDGRTVPALFTSNAIKRAIERAEKNPEDVPEKAGWLDRVFS